MQIHYIIIHIMYTLFKMNHKYMQKQLYTLPEILSDGYTAVKIRVLDPVQYPKYLRHPPE